MKDATQVPLSTRTGAWQVLGLLVGALMAVSPPTQAADAVARAQKASAPNTDKAVPVKKSAVHKISDAEKGIVSQSGTPPIPPRDPDPKQAGKSKKKSASSKPVKKSVTPAAAASAEAPAQK